MIGSSDEGIDEGRDRSPLGRARAWSRRPRKEYRRSRDLPPAAFLLIPALLDLILLSASIHRIASGGLWNIVSGVLMLAIGLLPIALLMVYLQRPKR